MNVDGELIGKVFRRLTILRVDRVKGVTTKAFCKCKCGSEKLIILANLKNGRSTSCGCFGREALNAATKRLGSEMVGQRFGRVQVVSLEGRTPRGNLLVKYRCDCGTENIVQAGWLKSGNINSCGCIGLAKFTKQITKHGQTSRNGATKEYRAWVQMRSRCRNPNLPNYHNYGGRGIAVCERWEMFENFLLDMGVSPEGTSIERKDNNKGYDKDNCKWATTQEQNANKRTVHLLEIAGVKKPIAVWARENGLSKATVYNRIRYGWPQDKLFQASSRSGRCAK